MKFAFILLVITFFSGCATQTVESQQVAENSKFQISDSKAKQMVLVELFTSEG